MENNETEEQEDGTLRRGADASTEPLTRNTPLAIHLSQRDLEPLNLGAQRFQVCVLSSTLYSIMEAQLVYHIPMEICMELCRSSNLADCGVRVCIKPEPIYCHLNE